MLRRGKFLNKDFKTYKIFGEKIYKIRENVLNNIKKLKKTKQKNYWLWSSSKSNNCT